MVRLLALLLPLLTGSLVAAEPFKVGVSIPLSGVAAEYGVAARNGFELAKRDHPELFENTRFIYEDNLYEAKAGVTIFNKFRTQDKVDLIYSWGEPPCLAAAPLAEKFEVPQIELSVDPKHTIGKDFSIRFYNYAAQYSVRMLAYLREKNFKRFCVVTAEDVYSDELMEGFSANLLNGESLDLIGRLKPDVLDFKTQIIKLKTKSCDVLINLLFPGQVSQFYRQAAQLRYLVPSVGFDVFASRTEIESASGLMEGMILAYHSVSDRFRSRYREVYGNDIYVVYAANTYEFALLTGRLFSNKEGSLSGRAIIELLKGVGPQDGELGSYVFRDDPIGGKFFDFPIDLMRIEDGELVLVAE